MRWLPSNEIELEKSTRQCHYQHRKRLDESAHASIFILHFFTRETLVAAYSSQQLARYIYTWLFLGILLIVNQVGVSLYKIYPCLYSTRASSGCELASISSPQQDLHIHSFTPFIRTTLVIISWCWDDNHYDFHINCKTLEFSQTIYTKRLV